eukprot:6113763-Pyramimonas_sp.AAC.1
MSGSSPIKRIYLCGSIYANLPTLEETVRNYTSRAAAAVPDEFGKRFFHNPDFESAGAFYAGRVTPVSPPRRRQKNAVERLLRRSICEMNAKRREEKPGGTASFRYFDISILRRFCDNRIKPNSVSVVMLVVGKWIVVPTEVNCSFLPDEAA